MAFPYKDIGTPMVNQGKSPFCPVYFFQQYINTEVREDQRDGISASFLQLPSQGPTISAQRPPQLQWSSWYSSVLNWKDFSSLNFFGVCNLSLLPHMVTQLNFIQLPYLAVVDMKVKFMKCQNRTVPILETFFSLWYRAYRIYYHFSLSCISSKFVFLSHLLTRGYVILNRTEKLGSSN